MSNNPKLDAGMADDFDKEFNDFMHSQVPEPEPNYEERLADSIAIGLYGADLISSPQFVNQIKKYPMTTEECFTRALVGEDIIKIRNANQTKARDNAILALRAASEAMMDKADAGCFFLRGNIPSLKNGKKIVTVKSKVTIAGKRQEFSTMVPSDTVTDYIKESKGEWLQNKVAFRNAVKALPYPLSIEFTFIRDSLRRFDVINALQIIQDLMVENQYIPDDESCYLIPVFNPVVYYHKQLAGVLIRIIK